MNEKKIDEQVTALFKVVEGYTCQENAEKMLYDGVTKKLDEVLPRFTPDRETILNMAGDATISNFRVGIKWYKNNTPKIID